MLSLNSLTIQYGSRVVLHDITLEVRSGEGLALIGPNGVGKSTVIRAASRGLKPAPGGVSGGRGGGGRGAGGRACAAGGGCARKGAGGRRGRGAARPTGAADPARR